jgi:hypothetical protein
MAGTDGQAVILYSADACTGQAETRDQRMCTKE